MEGNALIEKFLVFMQTERAAAENTVSSYQGDLRRFLEFCNSHPKKPTLTTVDSEIIQDYHEWLKNQNLSSGTINRRFACLRSFFSYLSSEGLIKENPTASITISRGEPRKAYRVLTGEEIEKLLEIPAKLSTPEGIRDLAMIEVLLATGMRPEELISSDVKEGKKLSLPLRAAQNLERYLKEARPKLASRREEKALFLNHLGDRLTRQGVWFIVKGYSLAAELEIRLTPRILRYSFAAQQLAQGVSPGKLQELLGHASPWTTYRFREKLQARN